MAPTPHTATQERQVIYFLSDTHLGSSLHLDPAQSEREVVACLRQMGRNARAIYLLGDMIDYWFEYRYVVPKGCVRFLAVLGELVDQGVEVHYLVGNHDLWMRDYLSTELGVKLHLDTFEEELLGKRFRLSHGHHEYALKSRCDALTFGLFESQYARRLCAMIHPRWTVGFARACSDYKKRKYLTTTASPSRPTFNPHMEVERNEWLVHYTKSLLEQHPNIDYYLYGHRHIMLNLWLVGDRRCMILGDWAHYRSYARWDGVSLTLETYDPHGLS